MWGKKKTQQSTAAVAIDQRAPSSVVYDNRTDYTGPIVIIIMALMASCPVAWWIGVFLVDTAGYAEPDKVLATAIITSVGTLAVLSITCGVAHLAGWAFLSDFLAHREQMKKLDIEREQVITERQRYLQITATRSLASGRVSSEDQRFVRLVKQITLKAFDHLATTGEYKYGDAYPWSREQAMREVLSGETGPVGWALGSRVSSLLREHGIIKQTGTAWNIDARRYPDMAAVESLLYRLYDKPIVINSPARLDDGNYNFTE